MKYEGKTKVVEDIGNGLVLIRFKDDITAGDGEKHDVMNQKGAMCAEITAITMDYLNKKGFPTHFIEFQPPRTLKAKKLTMFPLEVVVRFKRAGSFVRRYGGNEGEELSFPLVEFFIKDDERHDPMVCTDHIILMNIATREQVDKMAELALDIAEALKEFLAKADYELWDMKFEFGVDELGKIILGDEISPDTLRLRKSGEIFDKDVYRRDLGDPMERYREVLKACRAISS